MELLQQRLLRLEQEVEILKQTDAQLNQTLAGLDKSTLEIIDFFNAFKGGFKVLELIARLVRPMIYIFMFISATAGVVATMKELGVL